MMSKLREPISGLTHLFGAIISLVGMIILIVYERSTPDSTILSFTAILLFGLSLILLYTASTIYHSIKSSDSVIRILRKLDHSMIYVLIAGTYTPVALISLQGNLRWIVFIGMWSFAIVGVLFKMVWFDAPRWISTIFYVLMGWIAIFLVSPLSKVINIRGLLLLFIGGVFYTVGAVIYAAKWPRIKSKIFGFHEIFHLFVLAGSFCHYFMIFRYVL